MKRTRDFAKEEYSKLDPRGGKKRKQLDHTLCGHSQTILNCVLNEHELISCSQDGTIKVRNIGLLFSLLIFQLWDLNYLSIKRTLEGHNGAVFAIQQFGSYLFSCGTDVRVWDLNTMQCLCIIGGVVGSALSLTVGSNGETNGDYLFIGCQDTSIKVPNSFFFSFLICQYVKISTILDSISSFQKRDQQIEKPTNSGKKSSNEQGICFIPNPFQELRSHNGFVYCLASSNHYLYSGAGDSQIKVDKFLDNFLFCFSLSEDKKQKVLLFFFLFGAIFFSHFFVRYGIFITTPYPRHYQSIQIALMQLKLMTCIFTLPLLIPPSW